MSQSGERVVHFFTKVAGVSHRNDDGSSRQQVIKRCRLLEKLVLDHQSDNRHDPNAVRVCRKTGEQLGFLNGDLAAEVVRRSQVGYQYAVFIKNLTGGTSDAPTRGVNLLIVSAEPGVSSREAQKYVDQVLGSEMAVEQIESPFAAPEFAGRSFARRKKAGCFGVAGLALITMAVACSIVWELAVRVW